MKGEVGVRDDRECGGLECEGPSLRAVPCGERWMGWLVMASPQLHRCELSVVCGTQRRQQLRRDSPLMREWRRHPTWHGMAAAPPSPRVGRVRGGVQEV